MKPDPVHRVDKAFVFSSLFLKNSLNLYFKTKGKKALDIPCGVGRNIFLLSNYFLEVVGIDKEQEYIEAIKKIKTTYPNHNIKLNKFDIIEQDIIDFSHFDFVCNIQLFDITLLEKIVPRLKIGAFFLFETPECRGGNFLDLPKEQELKNIFKQEEILIFKFKSCNQPYNKEDKGSAKVLIRKRGNVNENYGEDH